MVITSTSGVKQAVNLINSNEITSYLMTLNLKQLKFAMTLQSYRFIRCIDLKLSNQFQKSNFIQIAIKGFQQSKHFKQQQVMQSIKSIFSKQKEYLLRQHDRIIKLLNNICEDLEREFESAYNKLDMGRHYANQTFIKEIFQAMQQVQTIIRMNTHRQKRSTQQKIQTQNTNPYLIDISLRETGSQSLKYFTDQLDIGPFLTQNRQSSHLDLTKKMLQLTYPLKISINCTHLSSIYLKSHTYQQEFMISDADLDKISLLNRITSLNVSGSLVTDKGLTMILREFNHLKELNISGCCLLTDQTIRRLSGNKFVNLKINELNSISEQAVLDLILHSYNLNYLEVRNSRQLNPATFLIQVTKIYDSNQASFKWLQINSDIGLDLFVNKLAYLTQLTSAESITDRQLEILLGSDKKHINGLFFTCCEQLNQETVGLICKQISSLKRLKLSKFLRLNDTHVKELVSQFTQLEYLNLDQCYTLTNNALKFVSQYSRELRYLSISQCRAINDQGLQRLCQKSNKLQYIDLSHLKFVSDLGVIEIAKHCQNLKSLILQKCDQITDESINEISSRIPALEQLVVNYCQNLTDSSLSLVSTRLRNLKRLQIQWCQVTQKCVGFISENLKNLKILNLNFCPSVCDKQIITFACNINSNLQVLKLESCDKISQHAFLALSQSFRKLKYLNLRQCIGVTDQVIKLFCASTRSRLKFIDLSWCSNITDKALFSLSQYQHQLSFLNLSGCLLITDIGIQWVITTLKNLQYLNLSLCQKITDKSVSLISQLKNLRKLYLCDLKRLTDVSISNLSDLLGLEQLHISGCCEVSSSSLLVILHNIQNLSGLNINECPNIKSEFLSFMLDKLTNLRKLQLSSLEINDQFLQKLGMHLQKLQYLNISMCGKISDNGLIKLVQQVPSLLKVDFQNTSITNRTKHRIVNTLNCRRMHNITLD